jgi:phage host-nuclease inhibitor protein Gam
VDCGNTRTGSILFSIGVDSIGVHYPVTPGQKWFQIFEEFIKTTKEINKNSWDQLMVNKMVCIDRGIYF